MDNENLVYDFRNGDYIGITFCREIMLNDLTICLNTLRENNLCIFGYLRMKMKVEEMNIFIKNINYLFDTDLKLDKYKSEHGNAICYYFIQKNKNLYKQLISSLLFILKVPSIRNFLSYADYTNEDKDTILYNIFEIMYKKPSGNNYVISLQIQTQYLLVYIKYRELLDNKDCSIGYYNGVVTYIQNYLSCKGTKLEYKKLFLDFIQGIVNSFVAKNKKEVRNNLLFYIR